MSDFLQRLVPISNRIDVASASGSAVPVLLSTLYSSGFVGAFLDSDDQPTWARRAARYLNDEFLYDTPGRIKLFGDAQSYFALASGDGECHINCRHALELWDGVGAKPYSCYQDYGSCVDASAAEGETTIFGWRAVRPEYREQFKHAAAWYKYANRGYCGDGWSGSGIATVARRVGVAFRIPYEIDGYKIDFTTDNDNEYTVARQWCRSGIPSWLSSHTSKNHAYEDGAITQMQGSLPQLKALLAAGGFLHHSGTYTSGGSRPFSIGRTGAHMQAAVGYDDSDQFRQFCRDVLKIEPRANDFPVVSHQTWGPNWSGETADQYWPPWWGPKPEGAWVWWASDLDRLISWDYAWLPRVKGFASDTPVPPPPPPPPPNIAGELYGETNASGSISIRGELSLDAHRYVVAPKQNTPGVYVVVPEPDV